MAEIDNMAPKRVGVIKAEKYRANPGLLDVSPGTRFVVKNLVRNHQMKVVAASPLSASTTSWVGYRDTVQVDVAAVSDDELGFYPYTVWVKAPDGHEEQAEGNSSPGVIIDR